jgi:hypothetical protein
MTPERTTLERRVLAAIVATPPRIPVLLGGCGSGRTSTLYRLRDALGPDACQYIDVERCATTPERFLDGVRETSPFERPAPGESPAGTRGAFDAMVQHLDESRAPGGAPATFLLDEVLELRTFESFPGLRSVMRTFVDRLAQSHNRFVLTSRYVTRAQRLLQEGSPTFEVIQVPPLDAAEVRSVLPDGGEHRLDLERHELSRAVQALADGRPSYVRAIIDAIPSIEPAAGRDPVAALRLLLAPGGTLDTACRFSYELRLHRARGYGALKAILDILAQEEPLTLTEIALRLRRTPGSTKDYLSWLEDVDLVTVRQKRYSMTDPLLRLWVRLHRRAIPPSREDTAREVHHYAMARLPQADPELAVAGVGLGPSSDAERRTWGIIEID